jgi:hypothetical protein
MTLFNRHVAKHHGGNAASSVINLIAVSLAVHRVLLTAWPANPSP